MQFAKLSCGLFQPLQGPIEEEVPPSTKHSFAFASLLTSKVLQMA